MIKRVLYLFIFLLLASLARGQGKQVELSIDTTDLSDLSLEELAKMKSRYGATEMETAISQAIEAASRHPLPLRKSPSIVSVITSEEIEKSGAKELMDILQLVPGLEFNVDVDGVVALSFRGMWANEGNISLQIDGMEVNEIGYASLQFGNHYAISQIKKIEIIRGPGSAIYGGCAEYAVINIITKGGADLKGMQAHVIAGQTATDYARQQLSLAVGNKTNDFAYSASGILGRGQRSHEAYTDVYGNSYNMTGNADMTSAYFNLAASYKGLSARIVYDNYQTTNRDGEIGIMSRAYPVGFLTCLAEVKYEKQWSKQLQLMAKVQQKYSEPWSFRGQPEPVDSSYYNYRLRANTYRGNVSVLWDPVQWLNLNGGVEVYNDRGRRADNTLFRTDSVAQVSYMNYAPYTQLLIKTYFANITVGARYDISSAFGSAFNPRLGITKKLGIFNFKLLYASSFRAPAIESIQAGVDGMKLKPEQSNTLEFETSIKMRKNMYLSVNIFDINTTNAIRYFVKPDTAIIGYADGYRNSSQMIGSQGMELEYQYKTTRGSVHASYSFYTVANKGVDHANIVPGQRSATLGTAQHKFAVQGCVQLSSKVFLSPSVNFLGNRYGYSQVDALGNGVLATYKPQVVLNLYMGTANLLKNMDIGVGIANVTNERILYPQAYNSLHAPLPGMGREYYVRLNYKLPFKPKQ